MPRAAGGHGLFAGKLAVARLAARASRRSGRGGGTALPGKLLLRMAPDAIERLAAPLRGAVVLSATNGKTTTAKMAAAVLEPPIELCRNAEGANLESGVASALLHGAAPGRLGLFEVDEAALEGVCARLRPQTLVLGNLFRDQLDRYGELELIGERWRRVVAALPASSGVIANADDPLVASIGAQAAGATSFGIEDASAGRAAMQHAADSKWCVRCGARLLYDAVYLGHLGLWRCGTCGLARPRPDVRAVEVRSHGLEAIAFTLETDAGRAPVRLPIPGLYNVYNALGAAAFGLGQGLAPAAVAAGLERFSAAFGRFERFTLEGRPAVLLLVKNPAGTNEVIRTLAADPAPKSVLVALNDRIADGRDVSWVWDVDFEELTGQVAGAVVTGTRAAEMGVRLKYAGLSPALIQVEPALEPALDRAAQAGQGPLYLLCTYTALLELRGLLADRGAVDHHWQAA